MKKLYLISIALCFSLFTDAQIKISEIATINPNAVLDDLGKEASYIEIANYGTLPANISGYGLTDNSVWNKWVFPSNTLMPANSRLLVFADGKNFNNLAPQQTLPNHWETAIYDTSNWQYYADTIEPTGPWTSVSFTPTLGWATGKGGFGYGDGDDSTITASTINAVYIRKTFTVTNKADLVSAIISLDYDDGVVFYLNGVLLGNKNCSATPIVYGTYSDGNHEAVLYSGGQPDTFKIDGIDLQNLLVNGTNVISAEVHNATSNSSDLSLRLFLHFGIGSTNNYYNTANPSWFFAPVYTSTSNNFYHTNFKLKNLKLIKLSNLSGVQVDAVNTNTTYYGTIQARIPDNAANFCFTNNPTPYLSNNTAACALGIVAPVIFNIASGNYSAPQSVTLSCATAGASIYYTTNGNAPNASATLYSTAISVSNTSVIRAVAIKANYISSQFVSNSYFINENTTLPVMSIVCDSAKMEAFQNASFFDNLAETEGSMEYFLANKGALAYKANCGVEQHGRGSTSYNPKPMRVNARKKYGESDFIFPFFDQRIYSTYDGLILRNGGNDNLNTHIRDYVAQSAVEEITAMNQSTKPVVVFLNGKYSGVFYMKEPQNSYYLQNRIGYDKDSTEFVRKVWTSNLEASKGTLDSFYALETYVNTANMTNDVIYKNALTYIDKKNYIDYFATEVFVANTDWLFNNIRNGADGRPGKKRKWQYLLWDLEWGFNLNQSDNHNTLDYLITYGGSYSNTFNGFMLNPNFKRDFINRSADLMNTIFKENELQNLLTTKKAEIDSDYIRMLSNYGATYNDWQNNLVNFDNFIANRPTNLRAYYASTLNVIGTDSITLNVNPAGAGRILISTIVPKTYPWTGVYFQGNPVNIQAIPNPGFQFSSWNSNGFITNTSIDSFYGLVNTNANFTANFTTTAIDKSSLVVSEINYNSSPLVDYGDWVELVNPGPKAFDASGYKITDGVANKIYTMPKNTVLQAGERIVLSNNIKNFYSNTTNVFNYVLSPFSLSSAGDDVRIYKPNSTNLYKQVSFASAAPWPTTPNGLEYTLEVINPLSNINTVTNWQAGCPFGSPGIAFVYCSPLVLENFSWQPTLKSTNHVQIDFTDLNKLQSNSYTILRSTNGMDFNEIGNINAVTYSKDYTFTDNDAQQGFNYYQIEIHTMQGKMKSNIKWIDNLQNEKVIAVIPNPANQEIKIIGTTNKLFSVAIYDEVGILQLQKSNVSSSQSIPIQSLANGQYVVYLIDNGVNKYFKLQVLK